MVIIGAFICLSHRHLFLCRYRPPCSSSANEDLHTIPILLHFLHYLQDSNRNVSQCRPWLFNRKSAGREIAIFKASTWALRSNISDMGRCCLCAPQNLFPSCKPWIWNSTNTNLVAIITLILSGPLIKDSCNSVQAWKPPWFYGYVPRDIHQERLALAR